MHEPSSAPAASSATEFTWRAAVLGAGLSALLAAANAYLGLFAGMTVSASIPAAVLSMGILRAVRGGLLENNLVQTAASAGESAAAGAIFTLPALTLLGAWSTFPYVDCVILVLVGGLLGVLFTVFLRRPLVVDSALPFPEGVATAAVLRAGHAAESSALRTLSLGGVWGGLAKLIESGLALAPATIETAARVAGSTFYLGTGISPALLAVGAIVGLRVALLVFIGGAINWLFVLPFVAEDGAPALQAAWAAWSTQTRYLGVGAMSVAGLAALLEVRSTIVVAVRLSWQQFRAHREHSGETFPTSADDRASRDLPVPWVLGGVCLAFFVLLALFRAELHSWFFALIAAALVMLTSFLFSAVAAYMAGLLGSSNNPVSGVTIATIIVVSLLFLVLGVGGQDSAAGAIAAIFVGSVVCTAAAIGGDNVQDLKAGQLLGASPLRQQVMQMIGVVAAALVLGPVLQLLSEAYGFGAPTVEHPEPLRAPQATLMAAVARGVFSGDLPWLFVAVGAGLGVAIWGFDQWAKLHQPRLRCPPLAVALGLYLPWELSVPVALGGAMHHFLLKRRSFSSKASEDAAAQGALLVSAGLITGEALMGVLLALVVVSDWGERISLANLQSSWFSIALLLISLAVLRRGFAGRELSTSKN